MPASTLRWWLEGGVRHGRSYPPVIRPEPTGSKIVTWGELVEARYLLGYRRDPSVQLFELRRWINTVRAELGVPYPLADRRPWVGEGRHIMESAQRSSELPADLWAMWTAEGGQILLTSPAESFLDRVEFEGDEVARLRPAGPDSPIVIDPLVRFGAATIAGIPTVAIAEQVQAGDPVEMVAEDFGLPLEEVVEVLTYELRPPKPVAA
ncbi:MAG TPA: DUF433 domain-containing protein [Acidimicrobiales bacterium]|nr:DUF433 domain-containing protein [Acidimicrobiales bacterium]